MAIGARVAGDEEWMLEDLAWRYAMMSELQIWLFSIGFLAFGGVMAALLHRGTAVLNRAPYFALTALVTLGIALGQMIWLQGGQAMLHGWLSALIGLEAGFSLAAGYAMVVLGQARSRDALGHGRAGILSLVPLANLWLLFTPGQEPSRADPVIALLRGGMGVTVGVALMLLARGLSAGLEPMITERVEQVTEDPAHAAT
ncbi:hypothetical protein, partial [Tabrizicola sp.]|uniref:hypothetical protein n=1 Tax=Tabrizicola sp. TaxID=2005166 RepID=UPI00286C4026